MSNFDAARLHNVRCELEALISEREGMIAENRDREIRRGDAPAYAEEAFARNADAIRACQVNFHESQDRELAAEAGRKSGLARKTPQ